MRFVKIGKSKTLKVIYIKYKGIEKDKLFLSYEFAIFKYFGYITNYIHI